MIQFLLCFILALSVDVGPCAGKSNTAGVCDAWANNGYCTGVYANFMSQSCDLACCQKAGFGLVGNGWCLDSSGNRLNLPGVSWQNAPVGADGSSEMCALQCEKDPACIGYMTEDMTKCDIILSSDVNAKSGISRVDSESRVFCFQKDDPVDCVRDESATKDSCTSACGTVTAVASVESAHGGSACSDYSCQPGDGACPPPPPPAPLLPAVPAPAGPCAGKSDTFAHCDTWANIGHCTGTYAAFMSQSCDLACCQKAAPPPPPAPLLPAVPAPAAAPPPPAPLLPAVPAPAASGFRGNCEGFLPFQDLPSNWCETIPDWAICGIANGKVDGKGYGCNFTPGYVGSCSDSCPSLRRQSSEVKDQKEVALGMENKRLRLVNEALKQAMEELSA